MATETAPRTTWTVTIPDWHPVSVNTLLALHWSKRSGVKRADAAVVATYCRAAGVIEARGKRRVSVTFRGGRGDCDNRLKVLLDCLTASWAIVDDSPAWLELGSVTAERGARQTTIVIEDLDPEPRKEPQIP